MTLCVAAPTALADLSRARPTVGQKIFDATVLRPLSFIQTVVGVAFFIPAYPVSLVTGGSDHVVEFCVTDPVDRTFRRPLGEL